MGRLLVRRPDSTQKLYGLSFPDLRAAAAPARRSASGRDPVPAGSRSARTARRRGARSRPASARAPGAPALAPPCALPCASGSAVAVASLLAVLVGAPSAVVFRALGMLFVLLALMVNAACNNARYTELQRQRQRLFERIGRISGNFVRTSPGRRRTNPQGCELPSLAPTRMSGGMVQLIASLPGSINIVEEGADAETSSSRPDVQPPVVAPVPCQAPAGRRVAVRLVAACTRLATWRRSCASCGCSRADRSAGSRPGDTPVDLRSIDRNRPPCVGRAAQRA